MSSKARAQGRRPCAHRRPARRRRHRQSPLGGALRPQSRRRVRGAGRDHPGRRRGDRAAALRRREFPQPAQDARQHGCVGSGDARAVALLAGDAAGQSGGAGAAGKGHRGRSRLTARRSACSRPAIRSRPIWAGRTCPKAVPVAERAALAAIRADSEDAWAHYALASVYLFNRRFDDCIAEFELALRLNPSFSPARGIYGVALSYRGRWEEGDRAARAGAAAFARAIPLPRSIAASPPIASISAAITRRRSACRAKRCASAPISSAPTAC